MSLGVVLIVDDQEVIRQAVGTALIKAGYDVLQAEDGRGAIQLLQNDDNGQRVDTIICDLQMPNVGGAEAISHFQHHFPQIPVVVLTGAPDFVLTDVLRDQGIADYLLKPVTSKRLLEVVRVTVRLHGLRRAQR